MGDASREPSTDRERSRREDLLVWLGVSMLVLLHVLSIVVGLGRSVELLAAVVGVVLLVRARRAVLEDPTAEACAALALGGGLLALPIHGELVFDLVVPVLRQLSGLR